MRSGRTYLIDGYNLIRRAFSAGRGDLEADRERLEVRLREFLRGAGADTRVILVYDGAEASPVPVRDAPDSVIDPRLERRFSPPGKTADEVILEVAPLELRKRGVELIVVTSDLKDIARRVPKGARHVTSEEFADVLDASLAARRPEAQSPRPQPVSEKPNPEAMSEEEAREWLRLFGEGRRGK